MAPIHRHSLGLLWKGTFSTFRVKHYHMSLPQTGAEQNWKKNSLMGAYPLACLEHMTKVTCFISQHLIAPRNVFFPVDFSPMASPHLPFIPRSVSVCAALFCKRLQQFLTGSASSDWKYLSANLPVRTWIAMRGRSSRFIVSYVQLVVDQQVLWILFQLKAPLYKLLSEFLMSIASSH